MTSTESYATAANQVRLATERAAETFRKTARTWTDEAEAAAPVLDLCAPVQRYFDLLQQAVDVNRRFAIQWAELVVSLSSSFHHQAMTFGSVVKEQTALVADLVVEQAETAELVAKERAAHAEHAEHELMRQVELAELQAAKQLHDQARADLARSEFAVLIAEQDLSRSATVDEMIDRLVSANYR